MQSNKLVTVTVSPLLILLLPLLLLTTCCECAQITTRFFYNNDYSPAVGESSSATSNADTNVKLLEESEKDQIPLDFYRRLDNVTDMYEFIEQFVDQDSIDPQLGIQENMKRNVERASAVVPRPANCMTESTTVPLTPLSPSRDPKISYYPKCTRVKRCNGCCNSELMSCQPTEKEVINFEVTKYLYGEKNALQGKDIIAVEQHLRCKCDCRIKAEDCNSYQVYRPDLCRCFCTNNDALDKCLTQEHKLWDETDCRCVCRENHTCTTGTIFDESQCKCIDPVNDGSEGTAPTLLDRRRFIVKAVPVETDNSTIYTT